jgi:hypothetical protein
VTAARRARQAAVGVALLAVVAVVALAPGATPAGASVAEPPSVALVTHAAQDPNNTPDVPVPHMLQRPNEGQAPKYDTDPGGWAQYAVFWGMCVALVVIAGLVFLESRRKLRAREQAQVRSSRRSEPVADSSEKAPESSARR